MTRVAVGILQRSGRVLVCQRKRGARYGLKWEFPGGKIEPGESVAESLIRELREELSIEVRQIERTEREEAEYNDGGVYEVTYCFVSEFEGEPQNNVFEEIRWVTPRELSTLDILEGNSGFIARLNIEAHDSPSLRKR